MDMWTDSGIEIMRDINPSSECVDSKVPTCSSSRLTASSNSSIASEESHNGDIRTSPSRDSPSAKQVSYLHSILQTTFIHVNLYLNNFTYDKIVIG